MKEGNVIEIVENAMKYNVETIISLIGVLTMEKNENITINVMIMKDSHRHIHYGLYQLLKELKGTCVNEMKWCHPSPGESLIYEKLRNIVDEWGCKAPHYLDCESKQELKQLVADFLDSQSEFFKEFNLLPLPGEEFTVEKLNEHHEELCKSRFYTYNLLWKLKRSLNSKRVDELINHGEKAYNYFEGLSHMLEWTVDLYRDISIP